MHADAEYITGVHRGDESVFASLYRNHVVALTRYAYGFVGIEDAAHDVVQEVFARVWQLGPDWNPRGSIAAYLFAAVRNRALNLVKADRAGQRLREALLFNAEPAEPTASSPDDVLLARVQREMNVLTDRQRDALRLRYEQGRTMPEVAAILGIDQRAAEKLVARAITTLRERMAYLRHDLE